MTAVAAPIRAFRLQGIAAAHSCEMDLPSREERELGFARVAGSEVVFPDIAGLDPYGRASGEKDEGPDDEERGGEGTGE